MTFDPGDPGHVDEHNRLAGRTIDVAPGDSIQDALDETSGSGAPASTVRNAGPPVVLLPGQHQITEPLVARSVLGLEMYGLGNAEIRVADDMDAALILDGTAYSRFGGFAIRGLTGTEQVNDAIHVLWDDTASARSSTVNRFADITIRNLDFVNGVRIGKASSGLQCDNTSWFNITIAGAWETDEASRYQRAFLVGDGVFANNLVHNAYKLTLGRVRYPVDVASSEFSIDGVGIDTCEVAFRGSTTRFCSYRNVRCEDAERLFVAPGVATFPIKTTLSNVNFAANAIAEDGEVVIVQTGGVLKLDQIKLGSFPADSPTPKIVMESPSAPAWVLVDGLVVGSANYSPSSPAEVFNVSTEGNEAVVRGFVTVSTEGGVSSIADYDSRS